MKKRILLELEAAALIDLIREQALGINDFRCLDSETKHFIRRSYLQLLKQRKPREKGAKIAE